MGARVRSHEDKKDTKHGDKIVQSGLELRSRLTIYFVSDLKSRQ